MKVGPVGSSVGEVLRGGAMSVGMIDSIGDVSLANERPGAEIRGIRVSKLEQCILKRGAIGVREVGVTSS